MSASHPGWSLGAGALAAIGAALCCSAPLLLVLAGLGGTWLSTLRVLEPFRPWFIAAAVIALVFAYRQIFKPLKACEPGEVCAVPEVRRRRQLLFWGVVGLVALATASPYLIVLVA